MSLPGSGVVGALSSQFVLSAWLFLRLLGLVYVVAFVSLAVQIKGLAGRHGIMPAADLLDEARARQGKGRFFLHPTLCWMNTSDRFLQGLCWAGAALGLLSIAGFAPVPVSLLLWVFYLSLFSVCPLFLAYQWDVLLLETGFLAIFISPWRWWSRWPPDTAPSLIVLALLYLLLFRLMFFSGWMKLRSRDPNWRNGTALQYHYETQPLPNRLSWYFHHLPLWFHKLSVRVMFGIELGAPLLIFAPAPWRYLAGGAIIVLMLLISATGSYGFFNLLAIVLCVPLFADPVRWSLLHSFGAAGRGGLAQPSGWPVWLLAPMAGAILVLTLERFLQLFSVRGPWLMFRQNVAFWLRPFSLVNSYGLFSVMTTRRLEIIVEGSRDGHDWRAYEFKWKPGLVDRPPRQAAPYHPRLDWQMWFAALSPSFTNPWFFDFVDCLLQGRPEVLALLRHNPFPKAPPRYVRALLFDYHFSDPTTRRQTGSWWRRAPEGLYCPAMVSQSDPAHTQF
jgi:hypothetical protein